MSLVVWLPLTKDLRQQGLSNTAITNHGATFNSAGKLGGCYLFDGSNDYLVGTYTAGAEISFAAWINMPTLPSGRHIFDARTSAGVGYQPMYLNNGSIQVGCSGSGSGYPSFNYTWVTNTWYHICVTHNTTEVKCYVNGVLIGTSTTGKGVSLGTCNFTLGSRCNQSNYSNVKINDVRIYDHCLSPMEVKQLSQGLVLHYPLNRGGFGQENLATCTTPQYNIAASTSNYNYFWINSSTLEPNTTYTFSAEVEVSDNIKECTIYNYTSSGNSGSITSTFPADGKRHSWTFTTTTTGLGLIGYAGKSGATAGHSAVYRNIKVEKGSIATPYIPKNNEALYTSMGLNGTTEYDCSGYCNNGIRTGTFNWTSDTPKYSVSTKFSGSNYILTDSGTFSWFDFNQLTLAGWMKPTNSPSSYSGSFGIAHNSIDGYYSKCFSISNSSSKFTINAAKGSTWVWITAPYTVPANEWHHYVATLNGTEVKMYVDGELVYSTTIDWGTGTVASDTRFQVGVDLPGSDETYQGYYSDVRAYATALSADDVKSLYQNCATIDPDGTIRGQIRS